MLEQLENRCLLATLTVTSTGDSGAGTLRQAILDSNAQTGPNQIGFNIPGTGVQTIVPSSPLPAITAPVTIDGDTQPGAHANTNGSRQGDNATLLIQLDGANLPSGTFPSGLTITGGGSTVRGLVIDHFSQGVDLQSDGNVVAGNFIGTTPDGSAADTDSQGRYQSYGVEIEGANNQIGGSNPADRNILSGDNYGVYVPTNPVHTATGNVVQGNLIGLDATGKKAIPSSRGIDIEAGSGMTIGGTADGAGNVITAMNNAGIFIALGGPDAAAQLQNSNGGHLIEGNLIGTDVTGTSLVKWTSLSGGSGQFQGNEDGIDIVIPLIQPQNPIATTIGGTAAGAGNVVSGNFGVGIVVNEETVGAVIEGNKVGTDITGTQNLGNSDLGLDLHSPASTVGGTAPGAANIFAYNHTTTTGDAGGVVFGRNASGSSFLENSVFANGTEGFITESITAPNAPVITSVSATSDGKTLIQGTLEEAPSATFRLEFYSNAIADPSGVGQGQTFLGSAQVTTDSSGSASFSATVSAILTGQGFVVGTATDAKNNTSEYSKEFVKQVSLTPTTTSLDVPATPVLLGQTADLMAIVRAASGGTPTRTVTFTVDGVAQTPVPLSVVGGQDEAILPESSLGVGSHTVQAAYSGDSAFLPSTSPQTSFQVVAPSAVPTTMTLLVQPGLEITEGQTATVQAIVAAPGETAPDGVVIFTVDGVARPAMQLSALSQLVDNQIGSSAALSLPNLSVGTHQISVSYPGDALFDASSAGPVQIVVKPTTIVPPPGDGPTVAGVERFGFHMRPTVLVLSFNDALDPASATNAAAYVVKDTQGQRVKLSHVVYDASTNSVAIWPDRLLNFHHAFTIRVLGTGPNTVKDAAGRALDGANTGSPGSDFKFTVTRKNLVFPSGPPAWTRG
jgi:hypothetical protein